MGLGLDTFTDPKRVMPGRFTTLSNARFVRGKRLEVRRGNTAYGDTYKLGNTGSPANSFGTPLANRLHVKRGKVLEDTPAFWCEYQEAAGSGQDSGQRFVSPYHDVSAAASRLAATPATSSGITDTDVALVNTCRTQAIMRDDPHVMMVDSCVVGGKYLVTIYSKGVRLSYVVFAEIRLLDGTLVSRQNLSGVSAWTNGAGWVMALAVSPTRCWLFNAADSFTACRIIVLDVTNPNWINSQTYTTGGNTVDALVMGSDVFVVGHNFDGGTGVVIKSAPTSTTTPGAGTFTAKAAFGLGGATLYSVCLARPKAGATKLRAFYRDNVNGLRGVSITASSGATVTGPTNVLGGTLLGCYQLAAVELGEDYLWVGTNNNSTPLAVPGDGSCRVIRVRENGSFGTGTVFATRGGHLASRLLERAGTDTASFWVRYWNNAYTESYLLQYQIQSGRIVPSAKQMTGRAAIYDDSRTTHGVATISPLGADQELMVVQDSFDLLRNSSSSTLLQIGLAMVTADYDMRRVLSGAEVPGALVVGGGVVGQWDGQRLLQVGALTRPTITGVTTSASGGSMSNGTYLLIAVPFMTDAQGKRHWGAPSDPFAVTLSGGGSSQQIDSIAVSGESRCFVFSTIASGTDYFRASDQAASGASVPRTCSDADLQTRERIYTYGGVLPNARPDTGGIVGRFGDRILFNDPEDDSILWCQKPPSSGYGPEFSDELYHSIPATGGPVTAIHDNVDKCVVFKERMIAAFSGDGYTANGQGGYSTTEVLYDHLGCPGPWAAVSTPIGIMFDTGGQGIWLLGRDLSLSYVGEGVDAYKSYAVRSCLVVPNESEVRWLIDNDTVLVFHYDRQVWSVASPFECWDMILVRNEPVFLRKSTYGNGGVYVERDGIYSDAMSGAIDSSLASLTHQAEMGWLNFAGVQGYMRMWRALFTGEFGAAHQMLLTAKYDYDDVSTPDAFAIVSATIGLPYEFQLWLKRAYAKALRLGWTVSVDQSMTVSPMSLSTISLEVGVLPRAARMKASKGA